MGLAAIRSWVMNRTQRIMLTVLIAMCPGLLLTISIWGSGVLWNLCWLIGLCCATEAVCVLHRGRDQVKKSLADLSAIVTACLITICLPPSMPLHLLAVAALAAVGMAKHAYGGLGCNIFNPAMVGFAVVLVSFPELLNSWPTLSQAPDALSGATLLTEFRYRLGIEESEYLNKQADSLAMQSSVAIAFAVGGLCLIILKVIRWYVPAGCLAGLLIASLFGYDQGSSLGHGSATFHLISGGFVAAVFFVATDPVTHPQQHRAQLFFGFIIGVLTYVIRAFGIYPDGIAFAVLLANCTVPLLDRMAHHREASRA